MPLHYTDLLRLLQPSTVAAISPQHLLQTMPYSAGLVLLCYTQHSAALTVIAGALLVAALQQPLATLHSLELAVRISHATLVAEFAPLHKEQRQRS
jgi:hypothetical protein